MRDQIFLRWVSLLPKAMLSSAAGRVARARAPAALHRLAMRAFARHYQVAWAEAEHEVQGYLTFAEFFSRRLKPGARPIDEDPRAVVSPVDGVISQIGYAAGKTCIQAKGLHYSLEELLGGEEAARPFLDGPFATIYLAPRDYHRIHAPLPGRIEGYAYIPGQFWPVNPWVVATKEALFCLNERLITFLSTPAGSAAVVKVGATCVSRIRASYGDVVTHSGKPATVHRFSPPIAVRKGEELGAFEMGSTVILLFEKDRVEWDSSLTVGSPVRMGKRIGVIR
jgi:phosphatidylserine decarboxylase